MKCSKAKRPAVKVKEIAEKTKSKADIKKIAKQEGWRLVNPKMEKFSLPDVGQMHSFATFADRSLGNKTLFQIFSQMINADLITTVITSVDRSEWTCSTLHQHVPVYITGNEINFRFVWRSLALYIRIQGLQNKPLRSKPAMRALRANIEEAKDYFRTTFGEDPAGLEVAVGITNVERFVAHFHIGSEQHYEFLCDNFRVLLEWYGETVCCDEKVFAATGNSSYIFYVPAKGQLGLWMCEMICVLPNGLPYMIGIRQRRVMRTRGEKLPVADIVRDWLPILLLKVQPQLHGETKLVAVANSFYFSHDAIEIWRSSDAVDRGVRFISATTEYKQSALAEWITDKVTKPGQWAGLYHEANKELFVHHWKVGVADNKKAKKYVLTNALKRTTGVQPLASTPGSDEFQAMFGRCDNFNSQLVDSTWPHKHGGHNILGERGIEHDFAFTTALINAFNVFECFHPKSDFRTHCLALADEIFEATRGAQFHCD